MELGKYCTIYVDDYALRVPSNIDVWRACRMAGNALPGYCYYNGLVAESCSGLCAVYCYKSGGIRQSCRLAVVPDMRISLRHPDLFEMHSGLAQLLLEKHPLECPVCPKNGVCALQDVAMRYGSVTEDQQSPVAEKKDIDCGGALMVHMKRCVGCGLCLRFSDEVVGSGLLVRGVDQEGAAIISVGNSEIPAVLSGNLMDICPVGVFMDSHAASGVLGTRVNDVNSIDVHDSVGTPIRMTVAHNKVLSIRPRETAGRHRWISDKVRFSRDAFSENRFLMPAVMVRKEQQLSWHKAIDMAAHSLEKYGAERAAMLLGPMTDLETLWVVKKLMHAVNLMHVDSHQRRMPSGFSQFSRLYTFGGKLDRVYEADAIILVGVRPIYEAPVLHTLLLDHWRKSRIPILAMSEGFFMPYGVNIGPQSVHLQHFLTQTSAYQHILENAQAPLFICGYDALSGGYGETIMQSIMALLRRYTQRKGWNGWAFLPPNMSFIGTYDLRLCVQQPAQLSGYGIAQSLQKGYVKTLMLLGYEGLQGSIFKNAFCIYQGSHKTEVARMAQLYFPEYLYTEKLGTYINVEEDVCAAEQAVMPADSMRDSVWILQELIRRFDAQYYVRDREDLREEVRTFYETEYGLSGEKRTMPNDVQSPSFVPTETWGAALQNFYMTDGVAQSSPTLQRMAHMVSWEKGKSGVW